METRKIPPVRVVFEQEDKAEILAKIDGVLSSGMVAMGNNVRAFEAFWCEYLNSRNSVAVANGGSGLELVMTALDLKGKDVLVTTNTFIATVNAVIKSGANPILVDIDPETSSPSLSNLVAKVTPNTGAVILVHIGGIISPEIEKINEWCKENNFHLIEDAAHAHGSSIFGKRAGKFGIAGVYSFYATKVITSCEGGCVVTDDDLLAEKIRLMRDYGKKSAWESIHTCLSMNHRMCEINAIIGLSQAKKLDSFVAWRHRIAEKYIEAFNGRFKIVIPEERSSWYKFMIILPDEMNKDVFKKKLKEINISLPGSVYDIPVHRQPVASELNVAGVFPGADYFCKKHVCLPIYYSMSDDEAGFVIDGINQVVNNW